MVSHLTFLADSIKLCDGVPIIRRRVESSTMESVQISEAMKRLKNNM